MSIFVVAENKNVDMKILLVKEGKVEIKTHGGALFGIIGNGDVVTADFNNEQNLVVLTRRNGKVEVYSENGVLFGRIGNGDAIDAKWNGDDLAITTKSGKVEVRNKTNSLIRIF